MEPHMLTLFLLLIAALLAHAGAGITSSYRRSLLGLSAMPFDADVFRPPPGYNAPEQVHITQGDLTGRAMTVSWVTPHHPGSNVVRYGLAADNLTRFAEGTVRRYAFGGSYQSGHIHHATLSGLDHATVYHYAVGYGYENVRRFSFKTPPAPGPETTIRFGVIGDLGQTAHSNDTLAHYEARPGDAVLFIGDLSYADNHPAHDNRRWDSWARFVERNVAYQPWIWTTGNHEIDFAPEIGETVPFKPFTNRYRTPFRASNSTEPFFYSVKMGPAHVIMLSSYTSYGKYTPQWTWLQDELTTRVDRNVTPWLIICVHSPWYNTNEYHYMEGETMRVQFERWVVDAKADIVFAGHVHSYERTHRVSNVAYDIANGKATPAFNVSAPVYVTIGDGGNIEGLATTFRSPQPDYSAFREASFGHATLEIMNKTHAYYEWHRNQDGVKVVADKAWFTNRYWLPTDTN
ncbi:purple acid phosphatase 2 [Brachypodium distachyon]|uniref:Purple acid phosphatase n=1 Tax=Brachypodium distachyon TaxID=15368 RepID=I1IG28_BRADI|nr:purple acid phosphatase 2 [Brachypodium distachyon]KQJ85612.1 hypothetical protein BRADI_4g00590v3 [Brachypodium distachyon]|eukprot:XP_003578743.2 purple acid phosphatase 2 [Brachypodium distachyon]